MADAPNTMSTLEGFFKVRYHDRLINAVPNWAKLQGDVGFSQTNKLGEVFNAPVLLRMEHGVIYALTSAGAFDLTTVDIVPAQTRKAQLNGAQILARGTIDYESAYSGLSSKEAFGNSTGLVVRNLWESIRKRVEIEMLYGQSGIGTVGSFTTDAATTYITFTEATWADGIWAGMEGAGVTVYNAGHTAVRISGAVKYVTNVDLANRKVTVAGDITGITNTDVVYFATAGGVTTVTAHNSCVGLHTITEPGQTSLFGITVASYSLWNGNSVAVGGTLTFAKIQDAIAKCVAKGLDSDIVVYINPKVWATMMSDQASLRRYDVSQQSSGYIVGAEELTFYGQNGKITLKAHPMCKQGYAYGFSPKLCRRIGATDVTFNRPAMTGVSTGGYSFFKEMEDKAGFELRCYSHQALFCEAPGKTFQLTGITLS